MKRIWTAAAGLALFGFPFAAALPAVAWEEDWTVATMAQDGSWGMATAGSAGEAIAAAIRNCRAKSPTINDCGAQFRATRSGWIVANLCGDRQIIVAAETREEAERAALNRETDLKRFYAPDLPPCRRVLTVGPSGAEVADTAPSAESKTESARLK